MTTQKDPLPILNSLFRDVSITIRDQLLSNIKLALRNFKNTKKLLYLSINLPISKSNFFIEECSLRIPPFIQVSREWDVKINFVSNKENFENFVPFDVSTIEKEISPRSQLLLCIQESEEITQNKSTNNSNNGSAISNKIEVITTETGTFTRRKIDISEEDIDKQLEKDLDGIKRPPSLQLEYLAEKAEERKKREEKWAREIETTPRIITMTVPTSAYSSPRLITDRKDKKKDNFLSAINQCVYTSTMEDIASLWAIVTSPLYKTEMNFENCELRAKIIENLCIFRGIHILDAISRVRTVLMCEQPENLKQYIGTIILERNVVKDLAPTITPSEIQKRILEGQIISIIDIRELNIISLKPSFLLSFVPYQPKWCIQSSSVRLANDRNKNGERYLEKASESTLIRFPLSDFESALSLNDIYNRKYLVYINFIVYDTKEEVEIMLGELKHYITRHKLLNTSIIEKKKEKLIEMPL